MHQGEGFLFCYHDPMATEIERKFLVKNDSWKSTAKGSLYRQGYLCTQPTVRVRIAGDKSFLTIKGPSRGIARAEYEYSIPLEEASEMLDHLCQKPLIEKIRYTLEYAGHTWEVDEFMGENAGLVVAEVELENSDSTLELPDWVGEEVSHDARYYNANLVKMPYSRW